MEYLERSDGHGGSSGRGGGVIIELGRAGVPESLGVRVLLGCSGGRFGVGCSGTASTVPNGGEDLP